MQAKALLLTAALASLSAVQAEQEVFFQERTRVAVSAEDLNVLVAEDGEVVSAVANESELHLLHQGGRLYFRVLAPGKTVPLFVEAQFGEEDPLLYTLLLDPLADLPSERIVIRDLRSEARKEGGAPPAHRALPSATRTRGIKSLLLAMARGWNPDGYRIEPAAGLVVSGGGVRREMLRIYQGTVFVGETWRVRNIGDQPLALSGVQVDGDQPVAAIGHEHASLAPGAEGELHIVRVVRVEARQ